jgi:hypothetical protein
MACFMSLRDVGRRYGAWLMTCDPIHGSNRSGVEDMLRPRALLFLVTDHE